MGRKSKPTVPLGPAPAAADRAVQPNRPPLRFWVVTGYRTRAFGETEMLRFGCPTEAAAQERVSDLIARHCSVEIQEWSRPDAPASILVLTRNELMPTASEERGEV